MIYHRGKLWCGPLKMNLHAYVRFLTVVMITATSVHAQTGSALPDRVDGLTTIPLDEAERHLVEHKSPTYPPLAKAIKIEGDVRLTLQIDSNGAVIRVVQSSGHPMLVQAGTDAAKQFRYRPFLVNGAPAEVLVEAVVSFSLYVPTPSVPFPEVTDINSVVIEYDDGSFKLRVSGGGTVEYDGMYRVVVEGEHERHIDPTEVQQLLEAFRAADFFSLRDDYVVGATDVGRTTISIQVATLRKVITDD